MNFFSISPHFRFCLNSLPLAMALAVTSPAVADTYPSLLAPDPETRQAVAIAASVLPPEHVTTDIVRLAGEYSYGNGFDRNITLEISPDGRFLYKHCNCENVIDQVRGKVVLQDGQVIFYPESQRHTWPAGMGSVLIPVTWDQRLYLVPHHDIVGFSNQVNRGIEPVRRGSVGNYFLREGDWDRPAEGKPNLPGEWKNRLLETPVTGKIAGKDPAGRWIIDLGKMHGVYDGMELSAWSQDLRQFLTIFVTETGTSTSAIRVDGPAEPPTIQEWIVYSKIVPPGEPQPPGPRP